MGWLEGVLTGYAGRHYAIQQEKREAAEAAAKREEQVLTALLSSEHPEIKDLAAAGVLDLANPRRRSGGLAGWMGEMDRSPYLPMIQRARARIQGDREADAAEAEIGRGAAPPTPSIPTGAGSVAAPPQGSAAQVSTSLVTGGPATAPTPAPPPPSNVSGVPMPPPRITFDPRTPSGTGQSAGPPPSFAARAQAQAQAAQAGPPAPPAQAAQAQAAPPAEAAQAAGAPPQPPPTAGPPLPVASGPPYIPGQVNPGGPGATTQPVGRMAPVRSPRTQLPGIFPTAADLQRQQSRATVQGKIEGYAEMYRMQGFSEQEAYAKAADLFERDLVSTGIGASRRYQTERGEWTDPTTGQVTRGPVTFDTFTGQRTLNGGRPTPPDLRVITPGRLTQYMERAAQEMGYPSATAVPDNQWSELDRRAMEIEAQYVQNRTEASMTARVEGALPPALANQLHVPFGTEGRQLTGQVVPTPEDRQRRFAIENIRTQVQDIRRLVPGTLPSENDLTGLAPNLASTIFARTTKRNEFAELSSSVNAVVNTLARAIQDQRGAQTENDAQRAYETLVLFKNTLGRMLTDPLGGDTIESADKRLAVTLAHLEIALNRIPNEPVIQPKTPTTTTGGPAGGGAAPVDAVPMTSAFVPKPKGFDRDEKTGKRYLDGKEF